MTSVQWQLGTNHKIIEMGDLDKQTEYQRVSTTSHAWTAEGSLY